MNEKPVVDPKAFWEAKIISWEEDRYKSPSAAATVLERLAGRASGSLRYRLWVTGKILGAHVSGKRVLELGCGSGLLAGRLLAAGAESYVGVDISEGAIDNARRAAEAAGIADKARFEVGSITKMSAPESDVVFSLGLFDWLTDDELDRLFSATAVADYLHAIAERRVSVSQWLHRAYVQISYGYQTKGYRPRYFSVAEIEGIARRYTDKPAHAFRDPRLSFGALVTTLDFDHQAVANETPDSLR